MSKPPSNLSAQDNAAPTGGQPWDLLALPQAGVFVFYDTPAGASSTGKPIDIGDLDGNGCGDIVVTGQNATFRAAEGWRSTAGHVRIVMNLCDISGRIALEEPAPPDHTVITLLGAYNGDMFGTEAAVGDFNGDGFDDIVVGAQNSGGPQQSRYTAGSVYIIPGGADFAERGDIDMRTPPEDVLVLHGARSEDRFGIWVERGNFDADEYDDVLIGANQADGIEDRRVNGGEAWILYGAADLTGTYGTVVDMQTPPLDATEIIGADYDDLLGSTVWGADVNGDGFDDALVSAALWRGSAGVGGQSFGGGDGPTNQRYNSGETFIVYGSAGLRGQIVDLAEKIDDTGKPLDTSITVIYGADPNDLIGEEIATGDIDGDGLNDVVVGSLIGENPALGISESGEAWVIYTHAPFAGEMIDLAQPDPKRAVAIYPDQPAAKGGDTIRVADVDNDGLADILYAAPDYDPMGDNLRVRRNAGMLAIIFSESGGIPNIDGQLILPSQAPENLRVQYIIGADDNDMMAYSLAVYDANGDGVVDIAPNAMGGDGARNTMQNAGEIYVIDGNTFLTPDAPRWATSNSANSTATPLPEATATPTPHASIDTSQPGNPERGEMLYAEACQGCHGQEGNGEGVGPALVTSDFVLTSTDEDLLAFLQVGRPGDHPANVTGITMPAYGGQPDWGDSELWDVIAYLRRLIDQQS